MSISYNETVRIRIFPVTLDNITTIMNISFKFEFSGDKENFVKIIEYLMTFLTFSEFIPKQKQRCVYP